MKTKLKKTAILFFCIALLNNCNQASKKTENNNNLQNNINTNNNLNQKEMTTNQKDCIVIENLPEIQGKRKFLQYVEWANQIDDEDDAYLAKSYTKQSTPLIFPIVDYWLKKSGYIPVSHDVFIKKMKDIFNIDDKTVCDKIEERSKEYLLYVTAHETGEDMITPCYFYFLFEYNILFRLVDFDNIVDVNEKNQYITCQRKNIYHYNSYLFNDSQSSLTWLLINDQEFLTKLVKEFGYDKEPRINKMVLENVRKEYTHPSGVDKQWAFENIFAVKNISGNMQIREGLMQYIVDNTTVNNNELLEMLYDYASLLFYNNKGYDDIFKGFTKKEKLKIAAYAGYYIEVIYKKLIYKNDKIEPSYFEKWNPGSFLRNELNNNGELLQEIQKNNYYGLSDYAEMIDEVMLQIVSDTEMYDARQKELQMQDDEVVSKLVPKNKKPKMLGGHILVDPY